VAVSDIFKLELRGDAPAIGWTNAEVEGIIAERDAALSLISGQATVIGTWRRTAERLEAERDSLRSLLDTYDTALSRECKRLRAALEGVLADIDDYERINNLAPSPGRKYCWQSVEIARLALEGE
jgi:hypothetical protein